MATAAKKTGFGLWCPNCDNHESSIYIDLNDLDQCQCSCCDAEFSPEEARDHFREQLNRWQNVVDMARMVREQQEGA